MSYTRREPSRSFSSRRERTWQRNQNTVAFAPAIKMGPISHTVLIAFMIALLGLIYLTQVTKTSFYGYQLNDQHEQLASLKAEGQDLQIENARLEALARVKDSNVAKAMADPSSVDYAAN